MILMNTTNLINQNLFQVKSTKNYSEVSTDDYKKLTAETTLSRNNYVTYNFKTDRDLSKNDGAEFANMFLKYYFKRISLHHKDIDIDDAILSGMPRIKNTRIPITTILSYLQEGEDISAIMEDFNLRKQDIQSSLKYSIAILNGPYYPYDN